MKKSQIARLNSLECIPCKSSDKIWIVVDPKTNKLYRCTFSQGLAEFIVRTACPEYEVRKVRYQLGRILKPNERSRGLYGIISTRNGIVLRCEGMLSNAEIKTECDSRYIQEIFLEPSSGGIV